ncbi:hypothetical protein [Nostoc sp.]
MVNEKFTEFWEFKLLELLTRRSAIALIYQILMAIFRRSYACRRHRSPTP